MVRDSEARNRRLAAVVFTDIVGYSALVNRDEALGARALDLQRRVVRRLVPAFGGREIETAGDSFLLTFGSAFAALRCIAAIQRNLAVECVQLKVDPPVLLRASVHLGDIEHRGRDIFGDGVNIAARLLPLSAPGGLAMSDQVHSQIRHRLEATARSIGPCELKNIRHPVEVFLLDADAMSAIPGERTNTPRRKFEAGRPSSGRQLLIAAALLAAIGVSTLTYQTISASHAERLATANLASGAIPLPIDLRHRTVAVLPFATLSSGPDDGLLATGIQDSVLTNLARVDDLRVISRTSVAQYGDKVTRNLKDIGHELGAGVIVEGSLQRVADKLLVQVQMIDAATDQHLWAQSYERRIDDLFDVESNIARQVAEAAQVRLSEPQRAAIDAPPTANVEAYTAYLKAETLLDTREPSGLGEARNLLNHSLELDSGFALAHVELSYIALSEYFNSTEHSEEQLWKVRDELIKAGDLQPNLPELHRGWGNYYFYGRGDADSAAAEFEAALKLTPNDPRTLRAASGLYLQQGKLEQARLYQRRVVELDPHAPDSYYQLGTTLELLHDFRGVRLLYDRLEQLDPKNPNIANGHINLAIEDGNITEAQHWLGESTDHYAREKVAYFAADLDEAIRQLKLQPEWQAMTAGAAPFPSQASIAGDLWIKGDHKAAATLFLKVIPTLEEALGSDNNAAQWMQRGVLAAAYAATGNAVKAKEQIRLLRAGDATTNPLKRGDALWFIAFTYQALGDRGAALDTLTEMLAKPSDHSLAQTRIDPAWRALREDPRFRSLSEYRPAELAGRVDATIDASRYLASTR